MKSRELDKMHDPFTYIKQDDDVGEVEGPKWVKSNGESAPEWIEDDDDFRVVLRRLVDWNEGVLGSDGVIFRTAQETTQQTNQKTVKKSRDRRDGRITQETTQQTTQDHPKKRRENNGEKRSDKSKHVIVALIKRFPKIKQTEMAKATGLSVKGVEKVFAQLKAANVIVRVGGKRFGQWQICKQESNT
jgi:predicted HTH transcriptional regulator